MTARGADYTTRIIKGGALIPETFTFIQQWDPSKSSEENIEEIISTRALGKPSLKREKDTVSVLRRRFVDTGEGAPVRLLQAAHEDGMGRDALLQLFQYYAMDADPLVEHFCSEYLYEMWEEGGYTVNTNDLTQHLLELSSGSGEEGGWSPPTARRVAQGLLSLARDFGLLRGVNPKKIDTPHLTFSAFVFIAYDLHFRGRSNKSVAENTIWHGYFYDSKRIEELLVRADQEDLLHYNRAGSTVRIDWELPDRESVVMALVE